MKLPRILKRLWFNLFFDPECQYAELYDFQQADYPATPEAQRAFIEKKAYELLPEWVKIEYIVLPPYGHNGYKPEKADPSGLTGYLGWKSIPARRKLEMGFA